MCIHKWLGPGLALGHDDPTCCGCLGFVCPGIAWGLSDPRTRVVEIVLPEGPLLTLLGGVALGGHPAHPRSGGQAVSPCSFVPFHQGQRRGWQAHSLVLEQLPHANRSPWVF